MNIRQGAFPLFRFAGIRVFLHWSWFLVAVFEIGVRASGYSSVAWNILEYLSLFLIVMMHEFGHALACRQVGGNANQIILWPLGGVAYVDPPPRPGAMLWSIAAGPLVNVAFLPVFLALTALGRSLGWPQTVPNVYAWLQAVLYINGGLLLFNLLPIYPLDGGQILRSLLWYPLGRGRSLMVATIVGFIGVAGLVLLAFAVRSPWLGVMAAFILMNCWTGLQQARALLRVAKLPRREGFACPRCNSAPPIGPFWVCARCRNQFDTFQTQAACSNCGEQFPSTICLDCGGRNPMSAWMAPAHPSPALAPLKN